MAKLGPTQLAEVLRQIPASSHPDLLVGIENSDDAGVFRLSESVALVQTIDFFTPIVDDPYAYGQIAAANALSDVYAMGGKPLTVLNIACFSPELASGEVWAAVIQGMRDKSLESGAVILGGHSILDSEPKFGMAVTGTVDPNRMFVNTAARPGDQIWLSKPLGTGILTTAAKADDCSEIELQSGIESMAKLNDRASTAGLDAGVRCGTDITGFGLIGHLYNIARASNVAIELDSEALPLLDGVREMVSRGNQTAAASRNREFVGGAYRSGGAPAWAEAVAFDPQTSGGLALFSRVPVKGSAAIGRVIDGPCSIVMI